MTFFRIWREQRESPADAAAPNRLDDTSDDAADERAQVAGERGIVSVNRSRSLQSRLNNMLAMGLISTLGIGLLGWYYSQVFARQKQAMQEAQSSAHAKAQGDMALPALGRVDQPEPVRYGTDPTLGDRLFGGRPELPEKDAWRDVAYVQSGPVGPYGGSPPTIADRRLEGPVYIGRSTEASAGTTPSVTPAHAMSIAPAEYDAPDSLTTPVAIEGWLRPTVTAAARASVLPTRQMLLPKGAFIDCTLETAIDSSLPGLTTCVTATDTFGADGKVVLLERGTKMVGETRGDVRQGTARLFVLWTEARTPTGVVVPLASPGTDELGRAGLTGTVDRHFLDRFGAAILISVIDGAVQAAAQSSRGGGAIIYNPRSSSEVVTEVLKSTVNIPPTLRKGNGDRIQVLVARDLDFRSVYELRPVASAP
ncbi:MAG: type IV secretion system protein VirB10 [Steroidobacteraceae bacterium]